MILPSRDSRSGRVRDWTANGPWLLDVRAILAESFERIHRSNLAGAGVVPPAL